MKWLEYGKMIPKSIEVSLRKKKRGVLEQVPMMREETFCDIFLLVSIIKLYTCTISNHDFKKTCMSEESEIAVS